MERRNFLKKAAVGGMAVAGVGVNMTSHASEKKSNKAQFNLKYAPSLGAFKEHVGDDPLENIRFAHDQGFRAIFDNRLMRRDISLQKKIAAELANRNMDIGPFVLYADFKVKSFVTQDPDIRKMLKDLMQQGLEVAERTGAKTALVVPGRYADDLEWDYQTANVIDNLRMCCEIVEPSGLMLVLEPLNALTDHPGLFLTKVPQAHMICKAVNSPSCKIVNDLYHQQITEGNLIPNIDMAWENITAFHVGDNPGRKEPGTGEINYKNIFKHIHSKGYDGVLCAEHGKSKEGKKGEKAFIKAYRKADKF